MRRLFLLFPSLSLCFHLAGGRAALEIAVISQNKAGRRCFAHGHTCILIQRTHDSQNKVENKVGLATANHCDTHTHTQASFGKYLQSTASNAETQSTASNAEMVALVHPAPFSILNKPLTRLTMSLMEVFPCRQAGHRTANGNRENGLLCG